MMDSLTMEDPASTGKQTPLPSVRAFMEHIVDYAGLFPPAKLPLDEAIHEYALLRPSSYAWMVSRFICPSVRLPELLPYRETLFTSDPPFRFAVLGSRVGTGAEFTESVGRDFVEIRNFQDTHGKLVRVEVFEVPFPPDLLDHHDADGIENLLGKVDLEVEQTGISPLRVFYEAPWKEADWRERQGTAIEALATHHPVLPHGLSGLKIRCGGPDPSDVPPAELIAHAIHACSENGVPLKATAGLHHPVRTYHEAFGAKMHGFFNVFGAGIIASVHHPGEEELLRIVNEEDPRAFQFTEASVTIRGHRVTREQIERARHETVLSFGSCSFDEPLEDMKALSLLQ